MFDWSPDYSVGVPEIDAQHRQLFAMAGDLHNAMLAGRAKATLTELLMRLITYTRTHFAAEEAIMQAAHYPGYASHKAEHDKLTQQVLEFEAEVHAGHTTISIAIMQFLKDWLVNHIADRDVRLGEHLRKAA